jgi:tRNA(Ile)-lysidine synthase
VHDAIAAALAAHGGARDARIAVALSGGRDSVALLDAAAHALPRDRLVACHVHHGLSPNAQRWADFCADACDRLGIAFTAEHVTVTLEPRASVEATARRARYEALASMAQRTSAGVVLLAQHQDDQAETLLLQLLRGAGPRGLAAMPASYRWRDLAWLRPLLDLPRTTIDAYVTARSLAYVDDESNAQSRFTRNALRLQVVPAMRAIAPGYPATLARAAGHQAEAARLMHELGALDAAPHYDGTTLAREALTTRPAHRARNVLRWFLEARGLPPPSAARLAAMTQQLCTARRDTAVQLRHAGAELGVFRERIRVHRPAVDAFSLPWAGNAPLDLAHGTLSVAAAMGGDLDAACLFAHRVTVRSRTGGERFRCAAGRPRRALASVLREAAIAPWERDALPLVFADETLAVVPGIGIDPAFRAAAPGSGVTLMWKPTSSPRGDEAAPIG